MKKIFILTIILFNILTIQLFCEQEEKSEYLLSDTSRELYDTGERTTNNNSIIIGEFLNSAISPNVFKSYGYGTEIISVQPIKLLGTIILKWKNTISFLNPGVPNPADDQSLLNLKIHEKFQVLYPFELPLPLNQLELTIAPYMEAGLLLSYHPQITNIGLQTFATFNLGATTEATYAFSKTIRAGMKLSSFLVGMDAGRNGYNKDFIGDTNWSHFGNYLDLNLSVFTELDISRTETLSLVYTHSVNSYFGGENSIISGEHQMGISYTQKLIR